MSLDSLLLEVFSSQTKVLIIVGLLLLSFTEVGFRQGLASLRKTTENERSQINSVQAAILGLLALLLGFSFSMAASRYDQRRELVLDEANAIQGAYELASVLPDEQAHSIREQLRPYVDARLEFSYAGSDEGRIATSRQKANEMQEALMDQALNAAKMNPSPLSAMFLKSLSDAFDYESKRTAAMRRQVPTAIWMLVLVVATVGVYATGYAAGASGARTTFVNIVLPVLLSLVITLIADLDRARLGVISISQRPMLELKDFVSGK